MLPKRQPRCDLDTLTWEYLDGETSPTRLAQLESLLRARKDARAAFVEHTQLHAMLHDHFKSGVAEEKPQPEAVSQETARDAEPMPRRKRRRGKSSAA